MNWKRAAAMAAILILTATVACFAQGTTEPPEEPTTEPSVVCESANAAGVTVNIAGERIYVERSAVRRSLRAEERAAIERYMSRYGCEAQMPSAKNREALRNALVLALEMDVCHVPFAWPPNVYLLVYQTLTSKWAGYVDVSARQVRVALPPLQPVSSEAVPPLRLTSGPTPPGPEIQPIRVNLQTPSLQLPPTEVTKQVVWVQPSASASRSLLVPERLPAAPTVTEGQTLSISIGGVFGVPETRVSASANANANANADADATANGGNVVVVLPPPRPPVIHPPQPPPTPPGAHGPLTPGSGIVVHPNPDPGHGQNHGPWVPPQPPPSAAGP